VIDTVMRPEKPDVLMVTGAYFPELSGAGLQCRELVRALGGAVACTILTTTTDRTLPAQGQQDGVPVFRVFVGSTPVWSKVVAAVHMTWVVWRLRIHFSILHLHGFSQKSMLLVVLGLLMRKRIAIKLTSVGHDDPASMRARGRLAYWCYSRAHMLFGVSPRFEQLFAASGLPAARFRLIPNGVDVTRFRPAAREEKRALRAELGLPAPGALILFVGFFSREKSPDVLFDAWSSLATDADNSSVLLFVGATRSQYYEVDPTLAVDIRRRASDLGLESRLCFVESTTEIERYQRAADIFVLSSVREGLPNALLEAMACATACIATRLEGVTDRLIVDSEEGLLVPPRDVSALGAALQHLLSETARARVMGQRARARIEQDFALTTTAQRYLVAYRELMAT
jgi:glycosyltransferase involved in cell wall biosynthesis